MKTLITFAFILFVSVSPAVATSSLSSSTIVKPPSGSFSFFRAHRQGPGISLSWAQGSSDVVEFVIERSYDGEFFDVIGGMECFGTRTHKFSDNDVFPGIIYYRVTAVKVNGTTESSAIESVHIVRRG